MLQQHRQQEFHMVIDLRPLLEEETNKQNVFSHTICAKKNNTNEQMKKCEK